MIVSASASAANPAIPPSVKPALVVTASLVSAHTVRSYGVLGRGLKIWVAMPRSMSRTSDSARTTTRCRFTAAIVASKWPESYERRQLSQVRLRLRLRLHQGRAGPPLVVPEGGAGQPLVDQPAAEAEALGHLVAVERHP